MPSATNPNISFSLNESGRTEFIFLGTGTSSSIPHVDCLTSDSVTRPPCKACTSTLTPEGKKNIRRNTGAVLRMKASDGRSVTIVVDAGKTFQAAAVEWFPKYGLRKIDAVLITHAHADAMNGLDDLRAWTLHGAIQPYVDVYLSQETFTEVQRSFPYLVSKEFASGGGDVPDFKWHIISDNVPFEIDDTGIKVTPFIVHHGRIFSRAPPLGCVPTPATTLPSTPRSNSPVLENKDANSAKNVEVEKKIYPLLCLGFKFQERLAYISDVSHIPDHVYPLLRSSRPGGTDQLPVLILDCLRLKPHASHLGIADSIAISRRVGARKTYLTGFSHDVAHEEYVTITEAVGGSHGKAEEEFTESEKKGIELIGSGKQLWVRPAHDGLRFFVNEDGSVEDETY